jgi:hypothetical protein
MHLKKKPIPNERERDFIVGHCIIFSNFFFLIMIYEPQTWRLMADKKLHIIYVVYIEFIQSFSSNHWIKINLDLKWNLSSKMLCAHSRAFCLCIGLSNDVIKILTYCVLWY